MFPQDVFCIDNATGNDETFATNQDAMARKVHSLRMKTRGTMDDLKTTGQIVRGGWQAGLRRQKTKIASIRRGSVALESSFPLTEPVDENYGAAYSELIG